MHDDDHPPHSDESLRYLRALGDPDRLRIVQLLRAGPKSVGEICRALGSPMANVSHHLHTLKETGIVSASKRGRHVIYRLDHVVETGRAGTHVLDFGCCRIEFGEGREPAITSARAQEQALLFLNRVLGRAPATAKRSTRDADDGDPVSGNRIQIVNPSFELPATPFFDTAVTGWQKEGDPSATGVFRNFPDDTPIPGSRFVENADGDQLATIAARKSSGLFQSVAGASYAAGTTYTLAVGVGVSSVQPPANDGDVVPQLRMSLTCTDDAGVRRELAGATVTPADLDAARLTPVSLTVGAAELPASCIGRAIGILMSAAQNTDAHPGHFILDDVTLTTRTAS